jgi:Na+/proline symporter
VAGLFAAALSTIDSGINSLTAVAIYDWMDGSKVSIRVSRIMSVLIGVLIIAAALISPFLGEYLIEIIAKIVGVFLGLLLGLFLLGLFVPRANTGGAYIGLTAASLALAVVWTQTALPHWWYGSITVGVTVLVGWLSSMLLPKSAPAKREALYSNIMRAAEE